MTNVVEIKSEPMVLRHDATEVDLASRIRAGLVTKEEIARRFEQIGFAEWFARQGLDLWRSAVVRGGA